MTSGQTVRGLPPRADGQARETDSWTGPDAYMELRRQEAPMNVCTWIDSPIGRLKLVAGDAGLALIGWENDRRAWKHLNGPMIGRPEHPILRQAEEQLAEYFAGQRREFSVKLDLRGTPFQAAVWTAMLTIPFGRTRSYGEIARQIGRPAAVRAVGAAVGMNPVAVMAPCHRVLGASGALTGFAGGLPAKRGLLAVEDIRYRPSTRDSLGDHAADLLAGLAPELPRGAVA